MESHRASLGPSSQVGPPFLAPRPQPPRQTPIFSPRDEQGKPGHVQRHLVPRGLLGSPTPGTSLTSHSSCARSRYPTTLPKLY